MRNATDGSEIPRDQSWALARRIRQRWQTERGMNEESESREDGVIALPQESAWRSGWREAVASVFGYLKRLLQGPRWYLEKQQLEQKCHRLEEQLQSETKALQDEVTALRNEAASQLRRLERGEQLEQILGRLRKLSESNVPAFIDDSAAPVLCLERGDTQQKVLICSTPKSGTYLLNTLLEKFGFVSAGIHLASWGFTDMRFGLQSDVRTQPARFLRFIDAEHVVDLVHPGQFIVGHLPFDEQTERLFSDYRVIVVRRNLRDSLVSFMRYMSKNGLGTAQTDGWGEWEDGPQKMQRYAELHAGEFFSMVQPMLGWFEKDGVLNVSYEELMGDFGPDRRDQRAREIAEFVGAHRFDAAEVLSEVIGQETLTFSGSRSRLEDYWSDQVEAIFEEHDGPGLHRALRYKA